MSICCQNLMMGGECLRLLMVVLSVLLHVVMDMIHHRRRVSVVRAFVHCLCFNLNWLLLRLDNCQRGRAIAIRVRVMLQVRIVHGIQVAHFNVLVEIADVWQLLLADVALINDVVGSRGRWQNRDRSVLSILSVLLLMSQDVLFQIRLLRVGLQADVAAVWTNTLKARNVTINKLIWEKINCKALKLS